MYVHKRKQSQGEKKRCPSLFLAADPSTFSRRTGKKKKKNVPMPGPRRVLTFFLILRAQYLVSVKRNTLQGDMVKKVALQWLTSPKNCRTHLAIPM